MDIINYRLIDIRWLLIKIYNYEPALLDIIKDQIFNKFKDNKEFRYGVKLWCNNP